MATFSKFPNTVESRIGAVAVINDAIFPPHATVLNFAKAARRAHVAFVMFTNSAESGIGTFGNIKFRAILLSGVFGKFTNGAILLSPGF